jgi:hypothetical protein
MYVTLCRYCTSILQYINLQSGRRTDRLFMLRVFKLQCHADNDSTYFYVLGIFILFLHFFKYMRKNINEEYEIVLSQYMLQKLKLLVLS